jgi:sensor histidine kinase YesM
MNNNLFNKSLFGLIPLVGLVMAGVCLISFGVSDASSSIKAVIQGITMTAGIWLGCMAIVTFLWKKFPWEENPIRHLFIEISAILVYTLLFSATLYILEIKYLGFPESNNLPMDIFTTLLITFLITAINESVFFYRQWKYNFSKSVRLEKDNLEAKYEALRAQINPHFLFNSLNSLTSMVEDNKPVVDYIQNLSLLLRYMMKSGENELVLLSEELEILRSYISLQMTRFNGSLRIKVDIPDSLNNHTVPPLVLQMLVENCMKHNIISRDKPLRVEIVADEESITVTNNLQKKTGVTSTEQGLNNIIGRYGFFTSVKIEVTENDEIFQVKIPLLAEL